MIKELICLKCGVTFDLGVYAGLTEIRAVVTCPVCPDEDWRVFITQDPKGEKRIVRANKQGLTQSTPVSKLPTEAQEAVEAMLATQARLEADRAKQSS